MLKNKLTKIKKKYWQVAIPLVAVIFFMARPSFVYAQFFNDEESSGGNNFTASDLDLGLSSEQSNFEDNSNWIPGSSAERNFKVSNEGDLKFLYGLKYESSDSSNLCGDIQLQVKYDGHEIYNDNLNKFDISYDENNSDFDHMMLSSGDSDHEYYFKVWLPMDTEDTANQDCQFDITAYAWQPNLDPYTGFWDEDSLSNNIDTTDFEEPQACEIGSQVFMIGDKEDSQESNPVDELNWSGEFGVFPYFANPFVVGTNTDDQFPWNSNYQKDEASDFDVKFFNTSENGLARLTISWSPGKSANEQKEVFLDGDSVGTTPERLGAPVDGWWQDMPIFEDQLIFPLSHGAHTLKFKQLEGDGTLWDYVKLEIVGCSVDSKDVLLNEIMWSGSTNSSNDEWIELFNNTDHEINLDYWTIENAGDGSDITLPEGAKIPSQGYYLISNFAADDPDSALSDSNISPDYITDLDLSDDGEDLILKDAYGSEVDRADGSGGWPAGDKGDNYRSMERNNDPDTGWHSCLDTGCNSTDFWDSESNNYGTPLAENKSDNDPSEQINAQLDASSKIAVDSTSDTGIETDSTGDTTKETSQGDTSEDPVSCDLSADEPEKTEEEVITDGSGSEPSQSEQQDVILSEETTTQDVVTEESINE